MSLDDAINLPKRKIFTTPRLLTADAYTIGSNKFESKKAKEKSIYYITFRRTPHDFNPSLYEKDDHRYVFYGLQRILEYLFYAPITHGEIDEAIEFLKNAKINSIKGPVEFDFPEEMWRKVVNEFNGRPPIRIKALQEGSVFYPNEPIIEIESLVDGMGVLAAWFESKLLHIWATCERVTQNEHWLKYCKQLVRRVYGNDDMSESEIERMAKLTIHDFGDRAGMNWLESEILGAAHLLTFSGTDTFAGAYQAWKNSKHPIGFCSVDALAHRNVQSYEFEEDCYREIYFSTGPGAIVSMVADCYSFYDAVENYIIPLAVDAMNKNNYKIIVVRPDSGNALEQVTWICRTAMKYGLYREEIINGTKWRVPTNLKFIEGDGMTWNEMKKINEALLEQGFPPFLWGLYGVGGGLRNALKRDNSSAKYALCAIGNDYQPVVKFSETLGKTTLPGPFKVLRDANALANKQTIVFWNEKGDDVMVEYFNGNRIEKPFGPGQDDDFSRIRFRIKCEMDTMPLNLETETNHNFPASQQIIDTRKELLRKYAPKKLEKNY